MTFMIVMGFHQIIVVMNDVKRHTYIHGNLNRYSDICLVTEYIICEKITTVETKPLCIYGISMCSNMQWTVII